MTRNGGDGMIKWAFDKEQLDGERFRVLYKARIAIMSFWAKRVE